MEIFWDNKIFFFLDRSLFVNKSWCKIPLGGISFEIVILLFYIAIVNLKDFLHRNEVLLSGGLFLEGILFSVWCHGSHYMPEDVSFEIISCLLSPNICRWGHCPDVWTMSSLSDFPLSLFLTFFLGFIWYTKMYFPPFSQK